VSNPKLFQAESSLLFVSKIRRVESLFDKKLLQ